MSISAADVNKLRKMTGAGMMDCKKALVEANGDFDSAIDYLRKKGQKVAAKRADRAATEGAVIALVNDDATKGVVVNVSCETDFVAKNADFVKFANSIAQVALDNYPASADELIALDMDGTKIATLLEEQVGKIGEKIEVSKYERMESDCVVPYIHAGNKLGVLVSMNQPKSDDIFSIGKDAAMQIAALSPVAVDKDDVDQSVIDKELEIGRELALAEGKPENMVDRIAQGKLQRFFKDNTLLNQSFVKDSKKTVGQVLKEVHPDLKITAFKRVTLG